jgi:hypothetical protein
MQFAAAIPVVECDTGMVTMFPGDGISFMRNAILFRRIHGSICTSILSLAAIFVFGRTVPAQGAKIRITDSVSEPAPGSLPPVIVIGFVGGFIRHDDLVHSEVQLAARLRKAYPSGVDVETFESYNGENARKKILSLLDTNHDGTLTPSEKQNARIILYGHSWGASESITVARELEHDGIPVLLTVQVDSVAKFRQNDAVIPANVAQAVNFYQTNGFVHGQTAIRAADPTRTKIIGNFRFDYKTSPYTCNEYPWYDRVFVKPHTQIECDPNVWKQAEDLIRADLPPETSSASTP